jgi:hypothetical protein
MQRGFACSKSTRVVPREAFSSLFGMRRSFCYGTKRYEIYVFFGG